MTDAHFSKEPDIAIDATVRAVELRFDEVPETEVTFFGSSRRESISGTERGNLPDRVEAGVVYRDSHVRLRIATRLLDADPPRAGRPQMSQM